MRIKIPYEDDILAVDVDKKHIAGIIKLPKIKDVNEEFLIGKAIKNPVNSKGFKEFLSGTKEILVIVNDATRSTPTEKVLDVIYEYLKEKKVKLLVSTGAHKKPTEKDFFKIFGKYHEIYKNQINVHDAKKSEFINLGTTGFGTKVLINQIALKSEKIITIGSVEPHYFAGFTGGRKFFLPGISAYRSIEQNHKLSLSPRSKVLALKGNPVHEDMLEALTKFDKEIFSIQTIMGEEERVCHASAGNIYNSFIQSVNFAKKFYTFEMTGKVDIIVAVMRKPYSRDFYQSHKGLENCKSVLKKDGIFIMVSKCYDGIGKQAYFNLLKSWESPFDTLENIDKNYKLGYHIAIKMVEFQRNNKFWIISDIPSKTLEKMFIQKNYSIQEAIDKAVHVKGESAKILFNLNAGNIVPQIKN
ncbi:MAG: nickel-dependent lactate racemase [Armatimonadetes bacterium]|nr:nickel-dependent lactate racemase [Armatimonadota bacterium]